ncbi:hypothetical protein KR222_000108 [Zaprionus bogoriensis]|nr:hypothetical protein KR222_000108 [Zaprionus bogoriensis]
MTSILGHVPQVGIGEALPEWAKFNWRTKIQHDIYRDWGTYYSSRQRENFSRYYFTKALELEDQDFVSLYRRSLTKAKLAQIDGALADARNAAGMALKRRGHNCPMNMQICDALFQLNQFENCKKEIGDNLRRFQGVKSKNFEKRGIVIDGVIKDTTNRSLSMFYLNFRKVVEKVSAIIKANERIDDRPRWKILKEMEKCDVQSIPDEEEEQLSPLEIARRKRAFNVIHQNYMNMSWHDVVFMKLLLKNPNLLLDYCHYSKDIVGPLSKNQYDVVRRFRKMIHARSPLYYLNDFKLPNKQMLQKNKEAFLFRIQYQTHRNMLADLRYIRRLRERKELKALSDYVEKIMGEYYVTKTNRVMCWKFQFTNEVYNILALALCEQYQIPKTASMNPQASLLRLLRLPSDKIKENVTFVFGDRSTYTEGEVTDPATLKARKLMSFLEKRIIFAKYSIEKCYLYHQIASLHLSQLHYDECTMNARRAIKESRNCNSNIWNFLSHLQIIKANVLQHKIEAIKEALEETVPIVQQLNSPTLRKFVNACVSHVQDEIRRKFDSMAAMRNSKVSASSSIF